MGMNFELARRNMIEQQVRPAEVIDELTLNTLETIHREDFVPNPFRKMAFSDSCLPLDHGQVMMKPILEGRMLQALAITKNDEVLEIGTGSGFITACLATLAKRVVTVDIHPEFTQSVPSKLTRLKLLNVDAQSGDVLGDWNTKHQFDAIAVTASTPAIPSKFKEWLRPGGRMFIICGTNPLMQALLVEYTHDKQWLETSLFETLIPPLIGAIKPKPFIL